MNITTIASGVLPVVMGLNLFWSALAIIIGSLIGAIFMASHSAQGPKLGIPQMIQSRAQFGVLGAVLPLLFVMLIYLGFFVSNTLLAAQALESVSPLPANGNIYLIGALCFVVALYGYRLIHRLQKLLSILSLLVFVVATLFALQLSIPPEQWLPTGVLAVEIPRGREHCRHLAAVVCAVCRRLFALPAQPNADRQGVLVQLRRDGQWRCVDDDSRGDPERRHRRLLQ